MSFKKDLRLLVKPYYLINILLSVSYIFSKRVPVICNYVFAQNDCELDGVSNAIPVTLIGDVILTASGYPVNIHLCFQRETEILFFLMIVIMIRTRKTGSVTMINYLTSSFVYTKIANLILWFYADVRMGILFALIFICKRRRETLSHEL